MQALNDSSKDLKESCTQVVSDQLDDRKLFIGIADNEIIGMSSFNAMTSQAVQLGGVYISKKFRKKGNGKGKFFF